MNHREVSWRIVFLALVAVLWFPGGTQALDYHGWHLPDKFGVPASYADGEAETLILNGLGFRKKFFFKIYIGALYLREKTADAERIITADEPMAVRMHFTFNVSRESMCETLEDSFNKAMGGNLEPIRSNMDHLFSLLPEKLRKGDVVDLFYVPGRGIVCNVNDQYAGESAGMTFKQAVFRIWLGDDPISEPLKQELLGQKRS